MNMLECPNEQTARRYLSGLKVKELKAIAQEHVVFVRDMNKTEMIEKIIRSTVIARDRAVGIQNRVKEVK
ncbi:hypothetical protein M3175_07995 [Robertmurraya korlensis]|uniref:hypothetical protein n=1 Tax=Robertmurraya korlensis TaxID=519977 RepID=UPI00203F419A|nr:hypothetical protein [Robertmurraya korlensis]MCM3600669.1 hypothetical protein [Robertmurraya korlensis]